jgi:hypothetical protein
MSIGESIGHVRAAINADENLQRAVVQVTDGRVSHNVNIKGGLDLAVRELRHQQSMSASIMQYTQRMRASITQADPEQEMDRAGEAYELLGRAYEKASESGAAAARLLGSVERVIESFAGLDFETPGEIIAESKQAASEAHELLKELLDHLLGA